MSYDIDDYSDEGILKPGAFLVMVILYSSRYLLYGPLSLLAQRRGPGSSGGKLDVSFLSVDSPFEILVSVPAILILCTILFRRADSKPITRKVWQNGRALLVLGALGQLAILLIETSGSRHVETYILVGGFLNLYVLYYLATSNRVKDVFSMFPKVEPPGSAPES